MSDYTSWHVGMKVVCINDHFDFVYPGERTPVAGRVYTVRTISKCPNTGILGLRFHEIFNPNASSRKCDDAGSREFGYRIDRFRPVQKRKTDISIFTAMLNSQPVVKGAREKA